MRIVVLAIVIFAGSPQRAQADRGVPDAWFETGVTALHYTPDKIDTSTAMYHLTTTPDDHALSAIGARFRAHVQGGRGWHAGVEFDFARFSGPQLTAQWIEHGTTMTMPIGMRGDITQAKLVVGNRTMFGPATFGGEVASGLQLMQYTTTDVPNYVEPWAQSWLVVEAHAKVDIWLTPKLTIGLESAVDLMHYERAQLGLLVGVHLVSFDGLR